MRPHRWLPCAAILGTVLAMPLGARHAALTTQNDAGGTCGFGYQAPMRYSFGFTLT
jgi:hypothetical protein